MRYLARVVVTLGFCLIASSAFGHETPPLGCQNGHGDTGPPQEHNVDGDSGDRYPGNETCHGKEGNSGSCSITRGSFEGTAHCTNKNFGVPESFCIGVMRCGSNQLSCQGTQVWTGVATGGDNEGRNYVHCRSAHGAQYDSWMWCD